MRTQHLNEPTFRRTTLGALLLLLVLLAVPQGALARSLEGKAWLKWTTNGVPISEAQSVAAPEIHLPSDYYRKPTYSSKAPQYATIDANTGVITYIGAGKGSDKGDYYGTVEFEVTLPETHDYNAYNAYTLTFSVYFGKQRYYINSKYEWNVFRTTHNSNYIVGLNCDLELGRNEYAEEFNGYFDGQGHTITYALNYESGDNKKGYTLFKNIYKSSVIKNLSVTGNGTAKQFVAGLAYRVKGKDAVVTIENCNSELSVVREGKSTDSKAFPTTNNTFTAGFVYGVEGYGTLHFKDCVFKGVESLGENFDVGGFVINAKGWYKTTVTFENCYSDLTLTSYFPDDHGVANYILYPHGGGLYSEYFYADVSYKNCYALQPFLFPQNKQEKGLVTLANGGELSTGIITYKLNAGRTGDEIVWVQDMRLHNRPQIKYFTDEKEEVHYAPAQDLNFSSQWATLCYPTHVTMPDGVQPYAVKNSLHDWNGSKSVELSPLKTINNRNVPMVLHSNNDGGIGTIHLPECYYNNHFYDTYSILKGAYTGYTSPAGAYLQQANGSFKKADEGTELPDFSCYLMPTEQTQDEYAVFNDTTNIFIINSKEEWGKLDSINTYNTRLYLVLNTDLELTDSDYVVENFKGVFDGRGHTITYNLTGTDQYYYQHGLFGSLVGNVVIRNLNIIGSISYPKKAGYFPCPLAWSYSQFNDTDSLVVENVHVSTDITLPDGFGLTSSGFIGTVYADAIATFRDCSFTGRLLGNSDVHCFGGFIGYEPYSDPKATPKVSFINCLSDFSGSVKSTDVYNKADYFVGTNNSSTASGNTITNSYARFLGKIYEDDGFVYNYYSNRCNVPTVTDEQLHSGELTLTLNAGRTGSDIRWAQTIGQDTIPQLKTFAADSKEVLYTAESKRAATADQWTTLFYPAEIVLPADACIDVYNDFGRVADTIYIYGAATNTIAANRPALLYSANGMPELTLPERYYNKQEFDAAGDVLCGSYGNVSADNISQLTMLNGEPVFKLSADTVAAWTAYVQSDAYDVNYIHDDGVIIASQDEWNTFKTKYNGRKVNARLMTPLTIASNDDTMEKYSGTFNACGQTINTSGYNLFKYAEGTILNVNKTGKSPLVFRVSGNLTFKNCKSVKTPLLVFTDHKATFDHCFSNMTEQTDNSIDAFVAIIATGASASSTNCYVWGTNCTNNANATVATDEQVKSGEVTYLLNDNLTDDCLWTQTIGTDNDPQLWSYDSETVYQTSGTLATNASGYGTCFYPLAIELPEGIKAYTATEVKDTLEKSGVLVLTELTGSIPAYTPVVLYSENGQTTTSALPAAYYNLTPVILKIAELSGPLYALPYDSENSDLTEYCWYLLKDDAFAPADSTSSYQSWTCYVSPNAASKAYDKIYIPNSTATAISALISTASGNDKAYDLQGRQVRTLRKGEVYIKNGVKFVVK